MGVPVSEMRVEHEIMAKMPPNLAKAMCVQMKRWLGVEATPKDLKSMDLVIRVDDRTPPEWMLLFAALQPGHWESVSAALEQLRKVRPETIKKRTVTATFRNPGVPA
jgi:hypothetical protein